MRRGSIRVPYENFRRTVEHLGPVPIEVRLMVRTAFAIGYLISLVWRPYHFDSIAEFLGYRSKLRPLKDRVILKGIKVGSKRELPQHTLEFDVSDETGLAKLVYQYSPIIVDGVEMPPDINDPLIGAQIGDELRLYDGVYRGNTTILVEKGKGIFIRNDANYNRLKRFREAFEKSLERTTVSI